MTVLTADFEKGTNGSAIAAADTGSSSAWDVISASGQTFAYDTAQKAHGSQAAKVVTTTHLGLAEWTTSLGTVSSTIGRIYLFVSSLPSANWDVVLWGGTAIGTLRISSAGVLTLRGNTATLATFATTIPTGQWIRLEWNLLFSNTGTGTYSVGLYTTADSTTAVETKTGSAVTWGAATVALAEYGVAGNITTAFWLDQVVENASAAVGPFPVNTTAPTVSGSTSVGSLLTATNGSWNTSGTFNYTYQWTRDGSNIAAATSSTYTTVSADGGHSVGCTITATGQQANNESASQASSNTISVVTGPALSTVVGKTGTSGTAVMQKAGSGYTVITGKTGTSGTAVDQKGAGSFTKIKGH